MKKIIYVMMLLLIFACQKEEAARYGESEDAVQFKMKSLSDLDLEINFATKTFGDKVKVSLGDSLRQDTILVPVCVMGFASEVDREICFRQEHLPDSDTTKVADIRLIEPLYVRAGRLVDTIRIILLRPEIRQKVFSVGLRFDTENSRFQFAKGATEQQLLKIRVRDEFVKPEGWFDYFWGEYGVEKHAFMVTVLGRLDDIGGYNDSEQPRLKHAYDEYNEAHPDAPKNFTFPF